MQQPMGPSMSAAPKFTPGPWHVNEALMSVYGPNGVLIVDMPLDMSRGKEAREDREYRNGNARLIAAAPELWTEGESLLRAIDAAIASPMFRGDCPEEWREPMRRFRAALAKVQS